MTNIGPLIVHYKWKFVLDKDNVCLNQPLADTIVRNQSSQLSEIREDVEQEAIETQQQSELFTENQEEQTSIRADSDTANKQDFTTTDLKKSNKLEELMLNMSLDMELPSIEEIFDISPLYGSLHPGESQELKITYYGHREIKAYVRAVCEVKNGPSYELLIKGEASVLNYELSTRFIDFGCIVSHFYIH